MLSIQNSKKPFAFVVGLLLIAGSVLAVGLQVAHVKGEPANVKLAFPSEFKVEVKDGFRFITANGIPNHSVGQFPGKGNPNRIAPQKYAFKVPIEPKPSNGQARGQVFGVAVNGVVFDPGTAELWNNNFQWHYEALSGMMAGRNALGADENLAHVQPNGAYHYHGTPRGLLAKLDYKNKMGLVGWAADGYPIYGPYAYSNPTDSKSSLKEMKSSYRLKSGDRPGGDGPGGAYDGSFASDYEWVRGAGDLDEYNGRTGVTPEFPKGTFYYVLTEDWPFIPRKFKGQPDPSFSKGGPGGTDAGNPGRGNRPGGPGGGFGGPGGPGGNMPEPGGAMGPGQPGPGGRPGFPRGMMPGDPLADYLDLTPAQKAKFAEFKKVVEALEAENFMMGEFAKLKLTGEQIHKVGAGSKLREALTADQIKTLEENKRPAGGPPGGTPPGQ